MDFTPRGSFRLFRLVGIEVYLHWTWFVIAFWQVGTQREVDYELRTWRVAEYVSLFLLVLLHEFGHALACRSVGGQAETIVLWPLGGVAYVAPPPRPGAFLWSIVAGPLVNLVLILPTALGWYLAVQQGWKDSFPDGYLFLTNLTIVNIALLVFNLLPIYPLDGGQIVFSLLWYAVGRWQSLAVVSLFGLILGGVGCVFCFVLFLIIDPGAKVLMLVLGFISLFVAFRSLASFQQARAFLALEALPRHVEVACPSCQVGPPKGPYWLCEHCQTRFDLFEQQGNCPACGAWYHQPACPHCQVRNPISRWANQPREEPTP